MDAREDILTRLRKAPPLSPSPRPYVPPLSELTLGREELIARLIEELTKLEALVHRLSRAEEVKDKLGEILTGEGITRFVVSTDEVVSPFDLPTWGKERGFSVYVSSDFTDRSEFKRVVFTEVDAGITGVDFAVAESGTLGIIHNHRQPRLISLAPITHLALLPASKVVAVYEQVVEQVFKGKSEIPSQFTFITGPSMTADIKATPFKGMHGPRKLIVVIFEEK